jgi:hypothetical protein
MSNFTKLMAQAAAGVGGGSFYDYEIENSLRSNPADLAELSRTFGTATSRTTFTISFWAKKSSAGQTLTNIMAKEVSAASEEYVGFYLDSIRVYNGATGSPGISSVEVDRDLSAWFHYLIAVDTTQATASDRIRIYKNGTEVAYGTNSNPSQNQNLTINSSGLHKITNFASTTYSDSTYRWNGYLAEFVFIDGTAYAPTDLGENKNGVWVPKDPSGLTYGNNGFWLKFDNASSLGTDSSGNGNNWTVTNYTSLDQMPDTPTNNFATFNPLVKEPGRTNDTNTYAEGNLYVKGDTSSGSANTQHGVSTILYPSSGSWYTEVRHSGFGGLFNAEAALVGVYTQDAQAGWGMTTNSVMYYFTGDLYVSGAVVQTGGATYTTGDIIGVFVDSDNDQIKFYKNGSLQYTYNSSVSLGGFKLLTGDGASTEWVAWILNAGQNGTFNGNVTAGGNTDANGIGDFKYTVPTDALALCTANLPEPAIGPNSATTSDENFNTVLYTGTGSSQSITGVGFQPDFLWIKRRSATEYHWIVDVLRTLPTGFYPPALPERSDITDAVTSFDSDGFTAGGGSGYTGSSGSTYVAWNWKAGGSGVSNTDGSITSTVSANTKAGISIVTYTGSSSGISVGHGLSSAPEMIIWKARGTPNGSARSWIVWTKDLTSTDYILYLNLTNAQTNVTAGSVLASSPTATTFSLGTEPSVNWNAENYMAYCFHSVEGFSSFGKFTGNGSADGSFIYTGFRPAFFLIKATNTTGNWQLWDASRDSYNVMDTKLFPDLTNAEQTNSTYYIDFVSNGIKLRSNASMSNQSGINFIYMAFAENPFKYANAR